MEKKIGIIGYGSMGKMFLWKFIESKIIPEFNLFLSNRTYDKIAGLKNVFPELNICKNNKDAAKNSDILFICVKPLEIKSVLMEIITEINDDCHIVSLNGSVSFEQIEKISVNRKISKVIPSVTAEVNQSVTLICHNDYVKNDDKKYAKTLLECFGTVVEIPETEIGMGAELGLYPKKYTQFKQLSINCTH